MLVANGPEKLPLNRSPPIGGLFLPFALCLYLLIFLYILIASIKIIPNKINPITPLTQLILSFTTASITIATRKIVATSFHIRNFVDETLNSPLTC